MMVPFLFTMGLCALSHAAKAQAFMTDLLPIEERVQIAHLSNGVKTYVQEHDIPAHCGSFRVVLKKASSQEELFRYDGSIESIDSVEQFFNYCKDKVSVDSIDKPRALDHLHFASSDLPVLETVLPQEIAVVAVGDFLAKEMQSLIEKYFSGLQLAHQTFIAEDPIRIGIDSKMSKVALSLSYPIANQSVRTYSDLKEAWKVFLLQDLFQQRLERCSRGLEEVWVHPHPRFFYPVNGYSLVSHEDCENLLTFFLWQVEAIRSGGFYEDEFYIAKRKLLNQLQYLASQSALPDDAFLASYFADQFLLGDRCLSLQSFMDASLQLVEEIKIQDLFPHIDSFLHEKNRSIQVAYPMSVHADLLTKDRIEKMVECVASLASLYRDSEIPNDEIWTLETQETSSLPVRLTETQKDVSSLIRLTNDDEPEEFPLAEGYVIPVDGADATAPFYQLPITEKEKRMIRVIITTIAEKNILQLAFVKRSVEKKGKKIEHIHPMRFMGYILSSSELRTCLRTIKKSTFKWDAFIDGFSRRMKEEYSNNNLYIYVPGFCQQIGGNQEVVTRYIQKKDWEGLVREHM
jgi:hypothetical protein